MNTLSLVKLLAQKHRYSGTDGEKRAQKIIIDKLKELGYKPKREVFWYINSERYLILSKLFFSLVLFSLILLSGFLHPLISSSLFVVYVIFKNKIYPRIEFKVANRKSSNIIATKNPNKKTRLIICGHYDSAKIANVNIMKYSRILLNLSYVATLSIAIYFILLLFFGIYLISKGEIDIFSGLLNHFGVIWFTITALSFIFLIYIIFTLFNYETKNFSKGADDNASSIAVMLKIAEDIKRKNLNMRIDFLFLGAEEQGLFGSRHFVEKYKKLLNNNTTYIVNLDCVGRGKLFLFPIGFGIFFRRKVNSFMYDLVREICNKKKYNFITDWLPYSDGTSFLKENFRVFTISRCNIEKANIFEKIIKKFFLIPANCDFTSLQNWIHSETDTVEFIDEKKLEESEKLLTDILSYLNTKY